MNNKSNLLPWWFIAGLLLLAVVFWILLALGGVFSSEDTGSDEPAMPIVEERIQRATDGDEL